MMSTILETDSGGKARLTTSVSFFVKVPDTQRVRVSVKRSIPGQMMLTWEVFILLSHPTGSKQNLVGFIRFPFSFFRSFL